MNKRGREREPERREGRRKRRQTVSRVRGALLHTCHSSWESGSFVFITSRHVIGLKATLHSPGRQSITRHKQAKGEGGGELSLCRSHGEGRQVRPSPLASHSWAAPARGAEDLARPAQASPGRPISKRPGLSSPHSKGDGLYEIQGQVGAGPGPVCVARDWGGKFKTVAGSKAGGLLNLPRPRRASSPLPPRPERSPTSHGF